MKKSIGTYFWYSLSPFCRLDFSLMAYVMLLISNWWLALNLLLANKAFKNLVYVYIDGLISFHDRRKLWRWTRRKAIRKDLIVDEVSHHEVRCLFLLDQRADRLANTIATLNNCLDSRLLVLKARSDQTLWSPQIHAANAFRNIIVLLPKGDLDDIRKWELLHEIAHTTEFANALTPFSRAPLLTVTVQVLAFLSATQSLVPKDTTYLLYSSIAVLIVWALFLAIRIEEMFCDAYSFICLSSPEYAEVKSVYLQSVFEDLRKGVFVRKFAQDLEWQNWSNCQGLQIGGSVVLLRHIGRRAKSPEPFLLAPGVVDLEVTRRSFPPVPFPSGCRRDPVLLSSFHRPH